MGFSLASKAENAPNAESSFDNVVEDVERIGIGRSSTGASEGDSILIACTAS